MPEDNLYNVLVSQHFDCDLSHHVGYGIFHLGHHFGTQNVSEFGTFWIEDARLV